VLICRITQIEGVHERQEEMAKNGEEGREQAIQLCRQFHAGMMTFEQWSKVSGPLVKLEGAEGWNKLSLFDIITGKS